MRTLLPFQACPPQVSCRQGAVHMPHNSMLHKASTWKIASASAHWGCMHHSLSYKQHMTLPCNNMFFGGAGQAADARAVRDVGLQTQLQKVCERRAVS